MPLIVGGFNMTDIVPGGKGAAAIHFPWEINVTQDQNKNYIATVRPGTVNELIPNNIFSSFNISENQTYFVKLKCDTDGKRVNLVTVQVNQTPIDSFISIQQNVAPPTFYVSLGVISKAVPYQVRKDNLIATARVGFLQTKTANSPLEEPFTRWWFWEIHGSDRTPYDI